MLHPLLRIGLDVDEVLLTYDVRLFFDYCEKELGWKIDRNLFASTHNFNRATGGKNVKEVTTAFADFLSLHPEVQRTVTGADVFVPQLAQMGSLHAVTARSQRLEQVTKAALKAATACAQFVSFAWGRALAKAPVVKAWQFDVFVEDSGTEIELMLEDGVNTTIIQFPAFRGCPQRTFRDDRVIRLAACDHVQTVSCLADKEQLWRHAWQQVQHEIEQRLPALSLTAP